MAPVTAHVGMRRPQLEARIPIVVEDDLCKTARSIAVAARTVIATGRSGELAGVRIAVAGDAGRPRRAGRSPSVAAAGRSQRFVARTARSFAVRPTQGEARPLRVIEAARQGPERTGHVAARAALPTVDARPHFVERAAVWILVAARASAHLTELRRDAAEAPTRRVRHLRPLVTGLAGCLGVRTLQGEARPPRVVKGLRQRTEGRRLVALRAGSGRGVLGNRRDPRVEEAGVGVVVAGLTALRRANKLTRCVVGRAPMAALAVTRRVPARQFEAGRGVRIHREPMRREVLARVAAHTTLFGERPVIELSGVRIAVAGAAVVRVPLGMARREGRPVVALTAGCLIVRRGQGETAARVLLGRHARPLVAEGSVLDDIVAAGTSRRGLDATEGGDPVEEGGVVRRVVAVRAAARRGPLTGAQSFDRVC